MMCGKRREPSPGIGECVSAVGAARFTHAWIERLAQTPGVREARTASGAVPSTPLRRE